MATGHDQVKWEIFHVVNDSKKGFGVILVCIASIILGYFLYYNRADIRLDFGWLWIIGGIVCVTAFFLMIEKKALDCFFSVLMTSLLSIICYDFFIFAFTPEKPTAFDEIFERGVGAENIRLLQLIAANFFLLFVIILFFVFYLFWRYYERR